MQPSTQSRKHTTRGAFAKAGLALAMACVVTVTTLANPAVARGKEVALPPVSDAQIKRFSVAMRAFNDICVGLVGNHDVNKAFKTSARYGVDWLQPTARGGLGFSTKRDLGVQMDVTKNGGNCVITTSDLSPDPLDGELQGLVSNFAAKTGGKITRKGIAYYVTVGNRIYLFRHDNRGGEGLVLHLRRK